MKQQQDELAAENFRLTKERDRLLQENDAMYEALQAASKAPYRMHECGNPNCSTCVANRLTTAKIRAAIALVESKENSNERS